MLYCARLTIPVCLILVSGNVMCVTCHFYNKTPYEMIISLDVPLAVDQEIKVPAGANEIVYTGFMPVRSYVVQALITKLNEKKPQKVLVYQSNRMSFRSLKCALFIEPLTLREAGKPPSQKKLRLDAVKFWVVPETPDHGEEADL